ncbi:hypothetical protein D9758_014491 [Tetrapyrgos nigripes]|uniref:NAD(P)-binding protein n=1 Tax=Tetrapyrgos nigripes TaxID=182062 RepID=A0A8H5FH65_9AGAR|nr:hypothetical protein D9758_014491 [Tetrapyrgos nigripes]
MKTVLLTSLFHSKRLQEPPPIISLALLLFIEMGPAPYKAFNPVRDLPGMKGKVIIVTGSSSGIGFAILQHLCRLGAKVYMTARSESRAKAAMERLEKEGKGPGNGEVLWHQLDLVDPRKAKESAEKFMKRSKRWTFSLTMLHSDSGNPSMNPDGIQGTMAVNYLGTYVFTQTLLPLLEKTAETGADARLINVHPIAAVLYSQLIKRGIIPSAGPYYQRFHAMILLQISLTRLDKLSSWAIDRQELEGAIMSDGAISNLRSLPFLNFWIWVLGTMMHAQEMRGYAPAFAACAPRADADANAIPSPAPSNSETKSQGFKPNPHIIHGAYIVLPNKKDDQGSTAMDPEKQNALEACTRAFLQKIGLKVNVT